VKLRIYTSGRYTRVMQPVISRDRTKALQILSSDCFSYLMTLKMLTMYPDNCRTVLIRSKTDWSCRTELPAIHSAWDSNVYPDATQIVMIDGNSCPSMEIAIADSNLPSTVYKVHDPCCVRYLSGLLDMYHSRSYLSFTSDKLECAREYRDYTVVHGQNLTDETVRWASYNGYTSRELHDHFSRGAHWFETKHDNEIMSFCIACPIYEAIWEIGAVYTRPQFRRQGVAARAVSFALSSLLENGRQPRYQFRSDNEASRALAISLGLRHVLTVDHFAP
jgi:GNAT superfamily N-acetyltransferase